MGIDWMHIFDRLWPKHFAHILEVIRHMARLSRLMRTNVTLEHIQREYEFRKDALEAFKAQAKHARQQEFHRIMTLFNPSRYEETLYRLCGLCSHDSGRWLFGDETFRGWLRSLQEEIRILWLRGIPGAGITPTYPSLHFQQHRLQLFLTSGH